MNTQGKYWLIFGGMCSFTVALLHVGILVFGPPAYLFFGAGEEMAQMAASGSLLPPLMTLAVIVIFTVWGLYALAGAGIIRRLPLLRLGLILIAGIYSLRGIIVFPQLVLLLRSPDPALFKDALFSFVSLSIGIVYFIGFFLSRKGRGADSPPTQATKQ